MGRIPDHLVSLAFRALENRWVTIGAKPDSKRPGKKKGGTPVELDGEGKITKGPAALTGKRPSELSQSHLFTGQDHKSQRKLFAEPGDPPPPPPIDEAPKAPAPAARKEPKPRAKKPLSMSLLAVIRREGGISSGDFEHADFKEFGLLGALNKKGLSLDDMAATMVRQGHMTVPMGKSSPSDHLLQLLKKRTNSLLAADTAEYDKDYEAYMQAREEAQADGYPEEQLAEASGRGEEAGDQESANRLFEEIFGGNGSGGEEAGRDEEPGDLAGDSAEPTGGVDTSFDFGPAAAPPKVEEKPKAKPKAIKPEKTAKQDEPAPLAIEPQAPAPPPPPATNLFGQPEPTKPQPATTQGLFGEQVPVEDPKVKPRETIADQAEKGLDWLDQKQDPKTDGTGEMFGGLFSPGRTSGATEPEAGPVKAPSVEPSPSATAPKATSLPDRIKNLNVLLNKTRSSANAKALRTAIDQLEREAKGPVEAPKVETANPAASQAPVSAEFNPASPPGVSAKDIPLDLAYNAHRGTSFVPEKRAQARVEEYVEDMKNIWSKLAKKATTPEQQATLKDEFERFRKGYVEKNKAMLSAMSRQVSSMIAGPSNFPAARMRKRGDTANKRSEEFLEFRKKAVAAIERKLDPSINGIRQAAPDASNQLNSKAAELRKEQEKMKAANNLIRKELKTNRPQTVTPQQSEKLKAGLAAIGLDAREVSSILKPDYMGQIGYQDFMLRNNLANIKRQEQRQAEVQQFQQSAPQSPETEYDGGVTVTEHPEDQRIRIKFPGKPNSEQIRELKARGFKWAPSQKAWSRILTSNARTAAQSVMKELGLNKVGADATTESRTLSTIRQQLREAFRQCP